MQLEKAFQGIPEADKKDYLHAREEALDIVHQESDHMKFLRRYKFKASEAAYAIVAYWKKRVELFGNRAILPLNLSGVGALTPDDVQCFKSGISLLLPNDMLGRSVICYKLSQVKAFALETLLRISFYISHVLSANEMSQTVGFVTLFLADDDSSQVMQPGAFDLYNVIFPVHNRTSHLFDCRSEPTRSPQDLLTNVVNIMGTGVVTYEMFLHPSQDKLSFVQVLESHGMSRPGIPSEIGGDWSVERHHLWMEERKQVEHVAGAIARISNKTTSDQAADVLGSETHNKMPSQQLSLPGVQSAAITTACKEAGDNHGKGPPSAGKPMDTNGQLLAEFDNAIHALPRSKSDLYMKAKRAVSQQVWTNEANPERFLKVEFSEVNRAASRVTQYWQLRNQIFGSKSFQPIDQTGEGALGRRELMVLQTGFVSMLPNDKEGRSVLWIDESRLREGSDAECVERCIFYMITIAAENDTSLTEGIVLFIKTVFPPFEVINVTLLEQMAESMPLRFGAIHVVSNELRYPDASSLLHFADQLYVHDDHDKASLCEKLESYGLTKTGLPKYLQGDWGYEKFTQWQELRARMEWKIPIGLSGREASQDLNFPGLRAYEVSGEITASERKRRLNVIHSRRKQSRERVEVFVLIEEKSEQQDLHDRLVQENRMLQELLKQAQELVKVPKKK